MRVRALLLLLLTVACNDDTAGSGDGNRPGDAGVPADAFTPRDAEIFRPEDQGVEEGGYGSECRTDDDCRNGPCADGRCSERCELSCPPFAPGVEALCRGVPGADGEVEFLCVPNRDRLCQPCTEDRHCDPGLCVPLPDGNFCGRPCGDDDSCPGGYRCVEVRSDAPPQCVPEVAGCDCTAATLGALRPCSVGNEHGVCAGEERCTEEGWTPCTAPAPAAETCNGVDDDCDGVADDNVDPEPCTVEANGLTCPGTAVCLDGGRQCVGDEPSPEVCNGVDDDCDEVADEDFRDEAGRYVGFGNCGACGVSCEGRDPNAAAVECAVTDDGARCIVRACADGYTPAGDPPTHCRRLQTVQCLPCLVDETCSAQSPGARCIEVGDGTFCGIDCSLGSAFGVDCPEGFECRDFERDGVALSQCVPMSGNCFCADNPEDFAQPCRVEVEGTVCQGVRRCDGDELGECELPDESCNGLDDDCDGTVDEGFVDGAGRYALQKHCGRCLRDCDAVAFPNAESLCDVAPETPTCAMRCDEGFVDLDGDDANGCECEIDAEVDHPDGADHNCDGIDGQIAVSVFVSKDGRPDGAGTIDDPLDSVAAGVARAAQGQLRDVLVAVGVYSENVVLPEGVNLYGGYSADFLLRNADHPVTLLGRPAEGAERGTLTLDGVTRRTVVDGLTVYGADAVVANSYAVYVRDADQSLQLRDLVIAAGNGADGERGAPGEAGGDGADGSIGGNAHRAASRECNDAPTDGGRGGRTSCGGARTDGGAGAQSACPRSQRVNGASPCIVGIDDCRNSCDVEPCDPLPPPQASGAQGAGAGGGAGGGPTYDRWSNEGECGLCGLYVALPHRGNDGSTGASGNPGGAGSGCVDRQGAVDGAGEWIAGAGSDGDDGAHGGGGGGGSAGSGLDITPDAVGLACLDTIGGSGGGGGAGGCAGTGGGGGASGGASFALFVSWSRAGFATAPRVRGCTLVAGRGGDGGAGGSGGVGGFGGFGAIGGIAESNQAFCAEPGGRGGNGGRGGAGGGGGGGCGGLAAGIFAFRNGNGLDLDAWGVDNQFIEGEGGRGGQGGASRGAPGEAGVDGQGERMVVR